MEEKKKKSMQITKDDLKQEQVLELYHFNWRLGLQLPTSN